MKRTTLLVTLIATTALSFLGACSDKQEVGSGVDTSKLTGDGQSALRDTTTTAAAPTTAAPAQSTVPPTTAKQAPATTSAPATTQPKQQVAITIGIYSDTSGKNQFEPRAAAVRRGQVARFQNFDAVARSVVDSGGAFQSPEIPPGGTWDYVTGASGTYNYADGTRPYAVGQLVVQ